ncbi:MAG TPA: carboxypeptidase regulatory-like domain-containing protein, partial [Bacillota bacterium]|nr:carboxypeptidase regulatory-like domain-containing protein [Bacillota bacterium]
MRRKNQKVLSVFVLLVFVLNLFPLPLAMANGTSTTVASVYNTESVTAAPEAPTRQSSSDGQYAVANPEQYKAAVTVDMQRTKLIKQMQKSLSSGYVTTKEATAATVSQIGEVSIETLDSSGFPAIKAYVAVKDPAGKSLDNIELSAFSVLENHSDIGKYQPVRGLNIEALGSSVTKADIVFLVDTTGSMSGEITTVINNLTTFANKLVENNINFRLAGISYGDEVPYRALENFTPAFDSDDTAAATAAANQFKEWVSTLYASGGADTPENPLDAAISAAALDFRPDAQKIIMLITDADAHVANDYGDSSTTATLSKTLTALTGKTFYYSCPDYYDDQYALLGTSLGEYFDSETLLTKLAGEITARYIVSYTSPNPAVDDSTRTALVKVRDTLNPANVPQAKKDYFVGRTGRITGRIDIPYEEGSIPLDSAYLTLRTRAGGLISYVKADSSGNYSMTVPVGEYILEATSWGRTKVEEKTVTVRQDATTTADFTLIPITGKALKQELIRKITDWCSDYSEEENEIRTWLESIPDEEITQAEAEAILRLVFAENVLASSL